MCTLFYAIARPFMRQFDGSVHTKRTRLATFTKLKSGSWRAQVRRKGKYVNLAIERKASGTERLEFEPLALDPLNPPQARSATRHRLVG